MGQRGGLKGKYSELNKEENIWKFAVWAQKFTNNIIDWFYVAHFSSWFSQPCLHKGNHGTILTVNELLSNKKETLSILVTIWMNFKGIMLSEKSQSKRLCIIWFHLYDVLEKANKNCCKSSYTNIPLQKVTVRSLLKNLNMILRAFTVSRKNISLMIMPASICSVLPSL